VYLQGIGQVKVTVHRPVQGRVKTIQVRRHGRRWMLVLSCDEVPTRPRETVAARHRKIANQRRSFHHQAARALVARDDLLVVENLKIHNTVRRPPPRPDPGQPGAFLPNRAAAKTGLHRSILRAGVARLAADPAA
jgi:hypothetical protein